MTTSGLDELIKRLDQARRNAETITLVRADGASLTGVVTALAQTGASLDVGGVVHLVPLRAITDVSG